MLKIKSVKITPEQLDENTTHLERAQWILNADRKLDGEDLREALQEIADVLENFETIREHASNIFIAGKTEPSNWREESNAPYLKPTPDKKPEKIGNIRI